jgi:hypothetical protein
VEAARAAAAEHGRRETQGRVVGVRGCRRRQGEDQPRHLTLATLDAFQGGGQGARGRETGARLSSCRNGAQGDLDRLQGLVAHVSAHHQHGVVRPVEAVVEGAQHRGVGRQQLVPGAEHRAAVGVIAEEARLHRHLQRVPRLAVVHGDLFQDHLALARDLLGVQGEGGHAVDLDSERLAPAVGGEVEVVGGRVVAGEGVVDAAQGLRAAVDLAGAEAGRALEHHVL